MDFPHNTPKHPCSSDDSLAIHQRFSVDWDKFRNTLIRKKLPQKTHRWYTLRAERFLTYLVRNNISEISDLHVRKYLQAAVSDRRLQDWQARQVVDAIRILCVDVLGGEGFDMVPWDDLLMSTHSLSPDHPTLARESMVQADGSLRYVKPKQGALAEVAAKHHELLHRFMIE